VLPFLKHFTAGDTMQYESAPWRAVERGVLDNVIDPRNTRKYIIDCLEIIRSARGNFISEKRLQSWSAGII